MDKFAIFLDFFFCVLFVLTVNRHSAKKKSYFFFKLNCGICFFFVCSCNVLLDESIQTNTMKQVIEFVFTKEYIDSKHGMNTLMQKSVCALQTDHRMKNTHRNHNNNDTIFITEMEAWKSLELQSICNIWFQVKFLCEKWGYFDILPLKNIVCTDN